MLEVNVCDFRFFFTLPIRGNCKYPSGSYKYFGHNVVQQKELKNSRSLCPVSIFSFISDLEPLHDSMQLLISKRNLKLKKQTAQMECLSLQIITRRRRLRPKRISAEQGGGKQVSSTKCCTCIIKLCSYFEKLSFERTAAAWSPPRRK